MSRIRTFIALALAAFCAAAPASTHKRTLSGPDFRAASAVAERVVGAYVRRDWEGMRALMSEEFAKELTDELTAKFDGIHALLGKHERVLLADEIVEVSPGCHEWRYAVAHANHDASLSFEMCGAGQAWAVGYLEIVPSVDAVVDLLFRSLFEEKGIGYFDPVCEGESRVAIGGRLTCWATTVVRRETTKVVLERKGPAHLVIAASEVVGAAPEPTRELLEPIALELLSRVSLQQYDSLLADASLRMQKEVKLAQISALLSPLHAERGPVRRDVWVGFAVNARTRLVEVTAKQVHADDEYEFRLYLMPDRGKWRLVRIDPAGSADARSIYLVRRVNIEGAMRILAGDPAATIECPWKDLEAGDVELVCTGLTHGRQVEMRTSAGKSSATSIYVDSDDLHIAVTSGIERLDTELGWTATRVACDDEATRPGDTTKCRVSSPQGDRMLTIMKDSIGQSIVDLEILR